MEEVLAELEAAEAELARLTRGARADARQLERREARVEQREREAEERERAIERRGREAADRYLLEARRDVERVIDELRERTSAVAGASDAVEAAAGEARRRVEALLREGRAATPAEPASATGDGAVTTDGPVCEVGDRVRSRTLEVTGEVVEVRPETVVIESRGMRFTLDADDLESAPEAAVDAPRKAAPSSSRPELEARPEVDLRGLRVDEVRGPLLAALDAAVVADLGRLVVIHGKGTGALREEVGRIVRSDSRIDNVRPGGHGEGGAGVTVLELRQSGPRGAG